MPMTEGLKNKLTLAGIIEQNHLTALENLGLTGESDLAGLELSHLVEAGVPKIKAGAAFKILVPQTSSASAPVIPVPTATPASATDSLGNATLGALSALTSALVTPDKMRPSDLIRAFAGDRSPEMVSAMKLKLGSGPAIVLTADLNTMDIDLTIQRHADQEEGDDYEGRLVISIDEFIERTYDADPLNGGKLSRSMKAKDGVEWPKSEDARLFLVYAVETRAISADMSQMDRQNLAMMMCDYPTKVPPILTTAHAKFQRDKNKGDSIIDGCRAKLKYRPRSSNSRRNSDTPFENSGNYPARPDKKQF